MVKMKTETMNYRDKKHYKSIKRKHQIITNSYLTIAFLKSKE